MRRMGNRLNIALLETGCDRTAVVTHLHFINVTSWQILMNYAGLLDWVLVPEVSATSAMHAQ
jgi:hypothetical protein